MKAIPVCICRALQGDWRQRTGKEKSRNLRDPLVLRMNVYGMRVPSVEVGHLHSSEEGPNSSGAKGGDCKSATIEKLPVLDRMIHYTGKGQSWKWKINPEVATVQENLT